MTMIAYEKDCKFCLGIGCVDCRIENYFAVSHGASLQIPAMVGKKTAKWLHENGAVVLTPNEYKQRLEALKELRQGDYNA